MAEIKKCSSCHSLPASRASTPSILKTAKPDNYDFPTLLKPLLPSPPRFQTITDDPTVLLEWDNAKRKYTEALTKEWGPSATERGELEDVVSDLLNAAVHRSHLREYHENLVRARREQEEQQRNYSLASKQWGEERDCAIMRGCHGGNWDKEKIRESAKIVLAREKLFQAKKNADFWVGQKQNALANFDALIRESAEDSNLSPLLYARMAEQMLREEEWPSASDYFNLAAANAYTVAQSASYRLRALQLEGTFSPEKATEILLKVAQIRDGLPLLYTDALLNPAEEGVGEGISEGVGQPYPTGTLQDIMELQVYALSVHYSLLMAALANPTLSESQIEALEVERRKIEQERRLAVKARTGLASQREMELHLDLFHLVAENWTRKFGVIEQGGKELLRDLENDFHDVEKLVPRSRFFEKLATLEWMIAFDGHQSLHLPKDGLQALSKKVLPKWRGSQSIAWHLKKLREEAQANNVAQFIFNPDGSLNPNVDVSELPQGIAAGDLTRSLYYQSQNQWREIGVPLGSAALCGGVAISYGAGPWVGGALTGGCALLGGLGNKEYNTRVLGASAYNQASQTGLTRVSGEEAHRYRTQWYWNQGANAMTGLMPGLFGGAGRLAGHLLIGGTSKTAAAMTTLRSILSSSGSFMRSGGELVVAGGRGFLHLPVGDKVRLALSLGYPVDYFFIDKDYQLVLGDGKLDTAIGFVGKAALLSELAYRGFASTWREGAKGGLEGFGEQLARQPWRAWAVRAGADLTMADYYLVNKPNGRYRLVDFDKNRETLQESREFEKQFGIDNWLGYAGLAAMFGDWALTEFRTFPMYIDSARRVALARGRTLVGAGMAGADLVENGELDKWYLGGFGGSLLMNEAMAVALEVDAWGSLVSTGFRIGWEWLVQWQQEIPLKDPDTKRLIWASGESAFMRFPSKAFVLGERYFRTFPLGRRLNGVQNWMTASERSAFTQGVASHFRSVTGLAGKPRLMPGTQAWKPVLVNADPTRPIRLVYAADGTSLGKPIEIRLHRQGNGRADARIQMNGTAPVPSAKLVPADHALLNANGYFLNGRKLYRIQPQYIGEVYTGVDRRRVTASTLRGMDASEKATTLQELERQGVIYDEGHHRLYQRWYVRPEAPRYLGSNGQYQGGVESTNGRKVVGIPLTNGRGTEMVWVGVDRQLLPIEEAMVGGTPHVVFHGDLRAPRMRWGIPLVAAEMTATAALANRLVFTKTMDGDPDFMPAAAGWQYAISELVVHPRMWKYGFDKAMPQFFGRLAGTVTRMTGNELFSTYSNSWPGAVSYYDRLDGVPLEGAALLLDSVASTVRFWEKRNRDGPLDIFANTMSTAQISPIGLWGRAHGSFSHWEERALETYLHQEACATDVLVDGKEPKKSKNCLAMHPRRQADFLKELETWKERMKEKEIAAAEFHKRRAERLVQDFEERIERERAGNLMTFERRTLILAAAHMKQTVERVEKSGTPKQKEAFAAWKELSRKYDQALFSKIPPLQDVNAYRNYVQDVNLGIADAEDFHYHIR